ncbi:hypothetical protein [Nocardia sp. NPDC047648]|uniref:hypothetical protein n=1 Tax=Nocardia sp. NPDC047648 TaxID=3155625 RepID=UPI0033FE8B56
MWRHRAWLGDGMRPGPKNFIRDWVDEDLTTIRDRIHTWIRRTSSTWADDVAYHTLPG